MRGFPCSVLIQSDSIIDGEPFQYWIKRGVAMIDGSGPGLNRLVYQDTSTELDGQRFEGNVIDFTGPATLIA